MPPPSSGASRTRFHRAESGPLWYQRKTECSCSFTHSNGYSRQRSAIPITRISPVRIAPPTGFGSSVNATADWPIARLKRSVLATKGQRLAGEDDSRQLHDMCFFASSRRGRSGGGTVDCFVGWERMRPMLIGAVSTGRPSAIARSVSKSERAVTKRSSGALARQRVTTASRSGCTFGFFTEGVGGSLSS